MPGEGLGNTFLLALEGDVARTGLEPGEVARRVCGDEVDGLLVVGPPAEGRMEIRVWNRDGSPGGACLNGLRVAALWTGQTEGRFRMDGKPVDWRRFSETEVELHLLREGLPEEIVFSSLELCGLPALSVPFWNPHCVVLVDDLEEVDLSQLAEAASESRELFPEGVNLEAITDGGEQRVRMRVWERGVGETLACGSGAIAVALLAWADGGAGPLAVDMPGGTLVLAPSDEEGILLAGPASVGPARDCPL